MISHEHEVEKCSAMMEITPPPQIPSSFLLPPSQNVSHNSTVDYTSIWQPGLGLGRIFSKDDRAMISTIAKTSLPFFTVLWFYVHCSSMEPSPGSNTVTDLILSYLSTWDNCRVVLYPAITVSVSVSVFSLSILPSVFASLSSLLLCF